LNFKRISGRENVIVGTKQSLMLLAQKQKSLGNPAAILSVSRLSLLNPLANNACNFERFVF
jgi:hypothetical protein